MRACGRRRDSDQKTGCGIKTTSDNGTRRNGGRGKTRARKRYDDKERLVAGRARTSPYFRSIDRRPNASERRRRRQKTRDHKWRQSTRCARFSNVSYGRRVVLVACVGVPCARTGGARTGGARTLYCRGAVGRERTEGCLETVQISAGHKAEGEGQKKSFRPRACACARVSVRAPERGYRSLTITGRP